MLDENLAAPAINEKYAADQQDGDIAAEHHHRVLPGNHAFDRGARETGAHQQLVGDGIEILAEQRLLMQRAGEQAVEAVASIRARTNSASAHFESCLTR